MRNDKYWERRSAELMYGLMEGAEAEADRIAKIYQRASGWLSLEAQEIFERFQAKHGLTEAEARRLVSRIRNKEDLKELLRKLESGDYSEIGKRELIRMLEAPAFQARLERLQQLQNQISRILRDVYKQELDQSTRFYTDLANEAYYRSMFEIQQRAGYGFSFNHVDDKTVNRILKSKWSGKNYSKRIWKNTQALADAVKEEILVNFITGRTDREAAEVIRNKFASGAMQARRLVRTEACFVSGEMVAQSYKEAGIEKYRYVATLDLRTSKVCRELDGQEFLVKDRQPGKNYPPMHPWCRSTTIAAPTAEELAEMKRRAWDPDSGRNILVPASMTYKEWYQKFVKGKPEADQQKEKIQTYQDKPKADMKAAGNKTVANASQWSNKEARSIIGDIINDIDIEPPIEWPKRGDRMGRERNKTFREYGKQRGIDIGGLSDTDLCEASVHEVIDDAAKYLENFPELRSGRPHISFTAEYMSGSRSFAGTTNHLVKINADAYRNLEKLEEEYQKLVEKNWFPQGTNHHALIAHEIGHVIHHHYPEIDPVEITMRISGERTRTGMIVYIRDNLSKYAAEYADGREIISECYACVLTGVNNEFALKFVAECDKIIKKKRKVVL